jgi:alpha-L-rhamnosidase
MTDLSLYDLTCEYFPAPLGVETPQPRLSWKIAADQRGARQAAYQVVVALTPDALTSGPYLWDSGKVESDQSVQVPYGGPTLASRQRVYWQVRVWDESGQASAFSTPAWWEMGLLDLADWQAQWIGGDIVGSKRASVPAPFLRKTFSVNKPVWQARLYITALGLYECRLNGEKVSEDVLAPGWTDYYKRVQYQVYDVTGLLRQGENALGAILGDGWYCGCVAWQGRQNYGRRPKLLAQLEIVNEDGSRSVIASDGTWQAQYGPITESDLLMGESYDARLEFPGWDQPGFDSSGWQHALIFPDRGAKRVARRGPGVRRMMEISPVADPVGLSAWPQSKWRFDLGQNMVGWVRLKVSGPAGTTVAIRFAEVLNPDGSLYTTNLRSARATDYYTLKGEGEEVFEPHFTFHGFRYVELSGFPGTPTRETVTGIVVYSEMPVTGTFECDDPLINQLQHNIQWGQRGNFVDVPTDCPQRDERLGWTGDAQVFVRTAAYNMGVAPFFTKWVQDLEDAQSPYGQIPSFAPNFRSGSDGGPAWADAFIICPWTIYLTSGDRRMLEEHYPSMRRYVDHLVESSRHLIRCHPDGKFEHDDWDGYGDWLSINAETPKELIGTAYLAYDAHLLAQIAQTLGDVEGCAHYEQVFEDVRKAFIHRYVTGDGLVAGHTQTAYVLALYFNLLPDDLRQSAANELVRDIRKRNMLLSTGFVGSSYLPFALSQAGQLDIAYQLLHQTNWPSWLYPVTQGATTIWERWDGWTHDKGFQDPGMNSFNHYAYGAIGDWLYRVVAGIELDPVRPGYRHFVLQPQPGGKLTQARATHESPYGEVASGWKIEDGVLTWEVTIPSNTTATLVFPGSDVHEGGKALELVEGMQREGDDWVAGAGRYQFEMKWG